MCVYIVTGIERIDRDYINSDTLHCIGYYKNFEDAEEAILKNATLIRNDLYDYIVIEKVEEGLYPKASEKKMYKYDFKTKKYEPTELHDDFKPDYICAGMS